MLKRISIIPFEAAIAILLILSGFAGLARFGILDPVYSLLPMWEASLFNFLSIFSGGLILAGVAKGSGKIEQFGLFLLLGIIAGRFLIFGHYFGYGKNFFQTGLFELSIIGASLTRLNSVRKRHVVVLFKEYKERNGADDA